MLTVYILYVYVHIYVFNCIQRKTKHKMLNKTNIIIINKYINLTNE